MRRGGRESWSSIAILISFQDDVDMMRDMAGNEIADRKRIQRPAIGLTDETELFIREEIEEVFRTRPHELEFFHQVLPAPVWTSRMLSPGHLVKTGHRRRIHPRKP